ncbi:Hsp70 family protein [Methylomagnum sp.]
MAGKILAYLKREGMAETNPDNVVVTVPASFQTAQRNETLTACRLAGLDVSGGRLLDEPVAAFIDYAYLYDLDLLTHIKGVQRLLVFDYGGGTCDIALFDLEKPSAQTPVRVSSRSVSRYHRLGGGDIDHAILHNVLIPQLCAQNDLNEFDLSYAEKRNILTPALIAIAESLKIQLSGEIWRLQQFGRYQEKEPKDVSARYPGQVTLRLPESQRTLQLANPTLNAEQFEQLLAPFLDTDHLYARSTEYQLECSIFAPVADALERAKLDEMDVDLVLAVGGSSLIPQVVEALRRFFPRARLLEYEDRRDSQLAVARGASLHALALAANGRGIVEPVAQDDIFISTQTGELKLIEKGTPLPYPPEGRAVNDTLIVPRETKPAAPSF